MDADRYRKLRQLFDELEPLAPQARRQRLDEACPVHDELRRELEILLDAADLFSDDASAELAPGTVLGEAYRIERKLGSGGFADTYLASSLRLHDKAVVIKRPRQLRGADGAWLDRHIRDEVRALASLNHPGIVAVLDSATDSVVGSFFVLQLIEGPTLRQELTQGQFAPTRAARLLIALAQALEVAHAAGVIHRDLKPENILLRAAGTPEEAPVLIDFGIASLTENSGATTRIVGSPDYLAPEQALGKPTKRSDLYALGCIAIELLTGQVLHTRLDGRAPQLAAAELLGPGHPLLPLVELDQQLRPASAAAAIPLFEKLLPQPTVPRRRGPFVALAFAASIALAALLALRPHPATVLTVRATNGGAPFSLQNAIVRAGDRLALHTTASAPVRLWVWLRQPGGVALVYPKLPLASPAQDFPVPGELQFDNSEEQLELLVCASSSAWPELEQLAAQARQAPDGLLPQASLTAATVPFAAGQAAGQLPFCGSTQLRHQKK